MSWKSIVIAGLLCVLATPVFAVPSLVVTSSYNNTLDVIIWEISVDQDNLLSVAVEAPLHLTQDTTGALSIPLNLRGNSSASQTTHGQGGADSDANGTAAQTWYYNTDTNGTTLLWNTQQLAADQEQNLGVNPFTTPANLETEGLWLDTANNRLFAALGSDVAMPQPVKTLHIASNDGFLNWTNLLIAEDGVSGGGAGGVTLTGFRSSIVKGNMNGIGAGDGVDFADLAGFGQMVQNQTAIYQAANPGLDGEARGDMNNSGGANPTNFGDLAAFGNCLQNSVCPPVEQGGAGAGGGSVAIGIPEPGTMALAGLAMIAFLGFFRNKQ